MIRKLNTLLAASVSGCKKFELNAAFPQLAFPFLFGRKTKRDADYFSGISQQGER